MVQTVDLAVFCTLYTTDLAVCGKVDTVDISVFGTVVTIDLAVCGRIDNIYGQKQKILYFRESLN